MRAVYACGALKNNSPSIQMSFALYANAACRVAARVANSMAQQRLDAIAATRRESGRARLGVRGVLLVRCYTYSQVHVRPRRVRLVAQHRRDVQGALGPAVYSAGVEVQLA